MTIIMMSSIDMVNKKSYQNTIIHSFEIPEAYSYFKTGSSFVGLTWLLTGISEGKIHSYLEVCEPCDINY